MSRARSRERTVTLTDTDYNTEFHGLYGHGYTLICGLFSRRRSGDGLLSTEIGFVWVCFPGLQRRGSFSHSFVAKNFTFILSLSKLALFCIKYGRFVEDSRQL